MHQTDTGGRKPFQLVAGGALSAQDMLALTQPVAAGMMFQLYGALIGVGLASDYTLDIDHGSISMAVKNYSRQRETSKWMAMRFDGRKWHFQYNDFKTSHADLRVLGEAARRGIEAVEKRALPPLIGLNVPAANRLVAS